MLNWAEGSEKERQWELFWKKEKDGSGYDEAAVACLRDRQRSVPDQHKNKVLNRAGLTQAEYEEAWKEQNYFRDHPIEKQAKDIVQARRREQQNAPDTIWSHRLPVLLKLLAEGLLCYFVLFFQIKEFLQSANDSDKLERLRKAQKVPGIAALAAAVICMGLVTLMPKAVTIFFIAAAIISVVIAVLTRKGAIALFGVGGALISYPYILCLRFIKGLPGGPVIWVVLSAVLFFVFDVLDMAKKQSKPDEEQEIKAEEERLFSKLRKVNELLNRCANAEEEIAKEERAEIQRIETEISEAKRKNEACMAAVRQRFDTEIWPAYLTEKAERFRRDLEQAEDELHVLQEQQEARRAQDIAELEGEITDIEQRIDTAGEEARALKERLEELNKSRAEKEAEIQKAYDGKLKASAAEYQKREDEVRREKEALDQELKALDAEEQSKIDAATAQMEKELSEKREDYEAELKPLLKELCDSGMKKAAGFDYVGAWACFHGMATNMLARPAIRSERTIQNGRPNLQELSALAAEKDAELSHQKIKIDAEDSCFMPCHVLSGFEQVRGLRPEIRDRIKEAFTAGGIESLQEFRRFKHEDPNLGVTLLPADGLYKLRLLKTGAKPVVVYYDLGSDEGSDERKHREDFIIGRLVNTYMYCVGDRNQFHVDLVCLSDDGDFSRSEVVDALSFLKQNAESYEFITKQNQQRARDRIRALSETIEKRIEDVKADSLYERNVKLAEMGDRVIGPYYVLIVMNSDYKDLSDSGLENLVQKMQNPRTGIYPILIMDKHYNQSDGSKEMVRKVADAVSDAGGVFFEYTGEAQLKESKKDDLLVKLSCR